MKSNCYISGCLLTIREAFNLNTQELMLVMLCDKHQIDVYLDADIDIDYPINEERLGIIYRLALQADDEFDGLKIQFDSKELFDGVSALQLLQEAEINESAITEMINRKIIKVRPRNTGILKK